MTAATEQPNLDAAEGRGRGLLAVALTAVALVPVLVVVVTRAGRRYVPVGDFALIDLRVRDVWSRGIPLVGPYSRLGWNHPGPAMFWLIAPLSGLTGRPAWATLVGAALLQGAAVVAIGWLAWRKGGALLVAAALAVNGLAYGAMGPSVLLEAWNPNVTYPFLLVLVLQSWCLADGDVALLPFTIAVATFLVQTHLGYLPLVGIALAFGLFGAWRHTRRIAAGWRAWRRPIAWSAAIFAVSWAPAVLQEIVHGDNLRPLGRALLGKNGGPSLGPHLAAGILGAEFHVLPPWLGGHTNLDPFLKTVVPASALYIIVPVVLLAAAALAAWRDARLRTPVALVALLAVVGYIAIARVIGGAEPYAFYWRVPIAILVVFVAGAAGWYRFGGDRRASSVRATIVVLTAVVLLASGTLAARTAQVGDVSYAEPLARSMLAHLRAEHQPRGTVLVRAPDTPLLGLERTVVNELDRSGASVRVDTALGFQFGYQRTALPSQVGKIWYVAEKGQYLSVLAAQPGAQVLWAEVALPPGKERTLRLLQRQLWNQLERAKRQDLFPVLDSPLLGFSLVNVRGIDRKTVDRVGQLNAEANRNALCRCGIIAFSPADDPRFTLPAH